MEAHALAAAEVLAELKTSEDGLSPEEAARRLEEVGANELPREKKRPAVFLFFRQFGGGLNAVLFAAVAVSFALRHVFDAAAILFEICVNAVVGFVQEHKAEEAIEKLRGMAAPTVTVRRGGAMMRVAVRTLVPGDIVIVGEGDRVAADLRLLECHDINADESALTGESVPTRKSLEPVPAAAPVADRHGMLFMGTLVTGGEGAGVVVSTGLRTAFGEIAGSLAAIGPEPTPLERRLSRLGRILGLAAVVLAAAISFIGLLRGLGLLDMFLFGVAAAVSIIPEGLPVVLAIVLAIGVQRMARRNAITRRLPAVETLGSVDVICSDKTGTLTENKMTVRAVATPDHLIQVTGEGWEPKGEFLHEGKKLAMSEHLAFNHLLRVSALCNRAGVELRDGRWAAFGDPTEAALVVLGAKGGYLRPDLLRVERTLDEIPFTSDRKFRAILHEYEGPSGRRRREIMVVGAFEEVFGRAGMVLSERGPDVLTPAMRKSFEDANHGLASQALRVLAVAVREVADDKEDITHDDVRDLSLIGLVGMIDPPRKGVDEAVRRCRAAGIRIIMNTGDHKATAVAVAREIGLLGSEGSDPERGLTPAPGLVFTDAELSKLTDEELKVALTTAVVLARMSPQTKLRVVTALKEAGHVVAMTGDGINDAPALKKADIGVAMGITGTDVTKEVADMVLADDNFVTIVNAVEEGRIVFRDVKQTTAFLVMTNVGEAATLMLTLLFGLPLPLLPAQLLWLNVVTDGFNDVTLATEPRHGDELDQPPRPRDSRILTRNLLLLTLVTSTMMAAGTLALYQHALRNGVDYARSVAFITMSLFQLWNVFNMRSAKLSIFTLGWFSNRWVLLGVLASLSLAMMVMYLPFFHPFFRLSPLGAAEWIAALAWSALVIVVVEMYKLLARRGTIPKEWL